MKHVYFSGIGGTAIGPLALIAHKAGFTVTGSDKVISDYIEYLISQGITDVHIGQTRNQIAAVHRDRPIDWVVYSSAVSIENPDHPELVFAEQNGIKSSKRDEFLSFLLQQTGQKMIAIAGTHGKTTTTAMMIWLMKELGLPLSYSVGAKMSFGLMGEFNKDAQYFVYEADEYDRNFLSFTPEMSVLPGISYDHPDIYPTEQEYIDAFKQFLAQTNRAVIWASDAEKVGASEDDQTTVLGEADLSVFHLLGKVNRENAHAVAVAAEKLGFCSYHDAVKILNQFPGVSRRFEEISKYIFTDYAHTPEKIEGALQLANEVSNNNVTVVYEGLHNTRQHFIKDKLPQLFQSAKKLIIVPSYLAREDESLDLLSPQDLCEIVNRPDCYPAQLDENLKTVIEGAAKSGSLVLCLSAGGGGSLDSWLRKEFS